MLTLKPLPSSSFSSLNSITASLLSTPGPLSTSCWFHRLMTWRSSVYRLDPRWFLRLSPTPCLYSHLSSMLSREIAREGGKRSREEFMFIILRPPKASRRPSFPVRPREENEETRDERLYHGGLGLILREFLREVILDPSRVQPSYSHSSISLSRSPLLTENENDMKITLVNPFPIHTGEN